MVASALCLWRMLAFYNLTYPTSSPDPLVLRAACRALPHIQESKTHTHRSRRRRSAGERGAGQEDYHGIKYAG